MCVCVCVCAINISERFILQCVCVCVREGMYMYSVCAKNFEKSHASGTKLSIANKKKFSKDCAQ